ncbi:MAG: Maf family protein [Hyphomicrobiaceae bacterium]|nr:Maf family protein [Hyphomicrobiaceae bacterium]
MAGHRPPLVLASKSATRVGLMRNAGLDFIIDPANVDERGLEAPLEARGADADEIALALAEAKALETARRHPDALTVGADQTLGLDHHRFHKPEGLSGARAQLSQLRGRRHALHSAIALARGADIVWRHVSTAHLTMRDFSDAFLDRYLAVAGDRVGTSVGGYQLEGPGLQLFERVEGDYFTILGLPMLPLLGKLRDLGVVPA